MARGESRQNREAEEASESQEEHLVSTAPGPAPSPEVLQAFANYGVNAGFLAEIGDGAAFAPVPAPVVAEASFQDGRSDVSSDLGDSGSSDGLVDGAGAIVQTEVDRHARVFRMIHAFRARGHRIAQSDPLGGQPSYFPELDPAHYGFGKSEMDALYSAGDLPGPKFQTLSQILDRLRTTYCGPIGVEFTHVQDPGRKMWLQRRMEETENIPDLTDEQRRRALEMLSSAEFFERFLHTKFLGQKRFSLEGAEAVIPALDIAVEESPRFGIREIVLGMSHRGRLNVLCNVLGKSYESIFSEFEDIPLSDSPFGSGDVKYHKGYSNDRRVQTGERIHLTLTSNPSHLEAVDPVVEGRARAKQVRAGDLKGRTILPLVLHGDAAFAGQGIVAETLNLSNLRGYSTGGTLHIVINNQIGFTTTPAEARSTLYCTDVAKMIQVPILHVNGDDPDAVVYSVRFALEYRERFGDDVVIDMVCYRRQGHNEGDEPSFTQPRLYGRIRERSTVRKLYLERLLSNGVLSEEAAKEIEAKLQAQLKEALKTIKSRAPTPDEPYDPRGPWSGYSRKRPEKAPNTSVPAETLAEVAEGIGTVPQDFNVHPKLKGLLERRRAVVSDDQPIDFGTAEALAFGSLLLEGTPVRLSGQDSSRGTFSHRHAVLVDQESEHEYAPLDHLSSKQARFEVYDSQLSEAAVLGFEYGYSLADPTSLVLWEAQFGDFANGAQVIIDQFITSAHVKWWRMSGLVMLLPHGYEGQGPEHSSARLERFLQLCAEDALQVANCTTPAQYFHLLRRQMLREYRAPLVIFTPKSLLRLPAATSAVKDFTRGRFRPLIDDSISSKVASKTERVLLCSGKVYYDLIAEREKRLAKASGRVAVVRLEELYPWPEAELGKALARYGSAKSVYWVQEEPANMGPWTFVRDRIEEALSPRTKFEYAGRVPSASPAVGSLRLHRAEQAALLDAAFKGIG